jgi:hypothetical protein
MIAFVVFFWFFLPGQFATSFFFPSSCWVKTVVGNVHCFVPFARTNVAKKANKQTNYQSFWKEVFTLCRQQNNHTNKYESFHKEKCGVEWFGVR